MKKSLMILAVLVWLPQILLSQLVSDTRSSTATALKQDSTEKEIPTLLEITSYGLDGDFSGHTMTTYLYLVLPSGLELGYGFRNRSSKNSLVENDGSFYVAAYFPPFTKETGKNNQILVGAGPSFAFYSTQRDFMQNLSGELGIMGTFYVLGDKASTFNYLRIGYAQFREAGELLDKGLAYYLQHGGHLELTEFMKLAGWIGYGNNGSSHKNFFKSLKPSYVLIGFGLSFKIN